VWGGDPYAESLQLAPPGQQHTVVQSELADFVDGMAVDAEIQQEDLVNGFRSLRHRDQHKKGDEKSCPSDVTDHFGFVVMAR
jgi:hypothetical protein